jgi:lactobin A/cerein 7B family class IIb bacteriocin
LRRALFDDGVGDVDHATNERLYVSLRPSGYGANGRAVTTGEVKMVSKELNTESCELTDEQLETVVGGLFPFVPIAIAVAIIIGAIKHH